jgi:phage terminase large subunit GpA-like protein
VICDEVDAYKWDVGGEGDPMTLIENRQRTFSRAKTFLVSTPTNADESAHRPGVSAQRPPPLSRALPALRRLPSPQIRQSQVPHRDCRVAHAGSRSKPRSSSTPGTSANPAAPRSLKARKPTLLARGRWIAERPRVKLVRGYHINSLYAPIGLGLGWRQIAQKWVDVQGDTAALKAFVNTYLGEVWREEGDGADAASVLARVEPYTMETLRAARKVRRLTAGVDVQKDRLECSLAPGAMARRAGCSITRYSPATRPRRALGRP